jgi:hypothetical protein
VETTEAPNPLPPEILQAALDAFWAEAFNDEPLDSPRRMAAAIDTLPRPSA